MEIGALKVPATQLLLGAGGVVFGVSANIRLQFLHSSHGNGHVVAVVEVQALTGRPPQASQTSGMHCDRVPVAACGPDGTSSVVALYSRSARTIFSRSLPVQAPISCERLGGP